MAAKIYHNPKCSTSRKTLDLLRDNGLEPEVVQYLKTPPSRAELVQMIADAGIEVRQAVRKREAARVPDTQPSLPLAAYAGRYEDAIYGPAEVRLEGERLHLTLLPARTVLFGAMAHWHHDVFRVDFPDRFLPFALVSFELDSTGRAERFRIDCPIPDFDFAKVPPQNYYVTKFRLECNWLQATEGDFDPSHAVFLHSTLDNNVSNPQFQFAEQRNAQSLVGRGVTNTLMEPLGAFVWTVCNTAVEPAAATEFWPDTP